MDQGRIPESVELPPTSICRRELTEEQQDRLLQEFSEAIAKSDKEKAAAVTGPGKVIIGDFPTRLDIPVARVCEAAVDWTEVLIIGTDENGNPAAASSVADKERLLWLASRFVHKLLWGDYDED